MLLRCALLLTALILTSLTAAGCGVVNVYHDAAPERWPLVQDESPQAAGARPTLLVRRAVKDDDGDERHGKLLDEAVQGVPEESGLFSRVVHQPGFEGYLEATDYVLDITLSEEMIGRWYTALGLIPGIPLVGHNDWVLSCRVLDRARLPKDVFEVRASQTLAAWLPLLPFNLIFSLLPGDFGMDLGQWPQDQRHFLKDLVRRAVVEAHRRVEFGPGAAARAATAGAPAAKAKAEAD